MAENVLLEKVLLGDTTKEYVDKINKAIDNVNSNADAIENLTGAVENAGKVDGVKVNNIPVTLTNKIVDLKVSGADNISIATTAGTGAITISAPDVAKSLTLSVDTSTYVLTAKLLGKDNKVLSTQTVDLPLETMVVDASYDAINKEIVLTLQNGNTTSFSVADLVSGLVPDSRTINGKNLKSNVTLTQDDVGDGTSYVRFTPAEKEKLKNIATGANNYQPPTYTGLPTTKGLYKIRVNSNGDVVEATAVAKSDITALGIAGNENATPSKAGLMSATDKAKLNGIAEGANKYVLPNAGATLGGVKSGGDVTIQDGVITVTSVGGKTADEIGKVKDVKVNGSTVLGTDGVANITIDDLKAGYVSVQSSSLVNCVVDGTTYKAIKVADTDTELEVYNSDGNKILTHTVREDGYLYICVGTTAINCTLRKINGNSVGTGGTVDSEGFRNAKWIEIEDNSDLQHKYINKLPLNGKPSLLLIGVYDTMSSSAPIKTLKFFIPSFDGINKSVGTIYLSFDDGPTVNGQKIDVFQMSFNDSNTSASLYRTSNFENSWHIYSIILVRFD